MAAFVELLLILFFLFLIGYYISDGDFFSPTCIASLGFIVSTLCAAINSGYWGLTLEFDTVYTITVGLSCYLIAECIVKFTVFGSQRSTSNRFRSTYINVYRINISNSVMILFIFVELGAVLLYLRQVIRVARRHGGSGSIGLLLNLYRDLSSFNTLDRSDAFPGWLNLLYVAVIGLGLFWSYVLVNNYMIDRKISKNIILNVVLIILSVIMNMVNANRTRMIMLAISIAIYIWFIYHRINGWRSGIKFKTLFKIAGAVIGFIVLFFGVRNLVGRNDSRSLLYVITHYFGVPIAGLNEFIKNPISSDIWGKETFAGINSYIANQFNRQDLLYATQKEFRNIHGINIGNVYTAFRSYLHDFGFFGMMILSFIESIVMSSAYYSLKKRVSNKVIDMRLLLFPLIYYADVLLFYADWFYEQLNISILRMVVILLVLMTIVNNWTIKFGRFKLVSRIKKKCID